LGVSLIPTFLKRGFFNPKEFLWKNFPEFGLFHLGGILLLFLEGILGGFKSLAGNQGIEKLGILLGPFFTQENFLQFFPFIEEEFFGNLY